MVISFLGCLENSQSLAIPQMLHIFHLKGDTPSVAKNTSEKVSAPLLKRIVVQSRQPDSLHHLLHAEQFDVGEREEINPLGNFKCLLVPVVLETILM